MNSVVCWVVAHPVQTILYAGIIGAQLGAAWALSRLNRVLEYPEMEQLRAMQRALDS